MVASPNPRLSYTSTPLAKIPEYVISGRQWHYIGRIGDMSIQRDWAPGVSPERQKSPMTNWTYFA